jgi:hypothetical protein
LKKYHLATLAMEGKNLSVSIELKLLAHFVVATVHRTEADYLPLKILINK